MHYMWYNKTPMRQHINVGEWWTMCDTTCQRIRQCANAIVTRKCTCAISKQVRCMSSYITNHSIVMSQFRVTDIWSLILLTKYRLSSCLDTFFSFGKTINNNYHHCWITEINSFLIHNRLISSIEYILTHSCLAATIRWHPINRDNFQINSGSNGLNITLST